jgi:hypothetical protein
VLENILLAPLVAVLACVCSVGNIPLAATLWGHGVAFGGVIAFIFADLIALPQWHCLPATFPSGRRSS